MLRAAYRRQGELRVERWGFQVPRVLFMHWPLNVLALDVLASSCLSSYCVGLLMPVLFMLFDTSRLAPL